MFVCDITYLQNFILNKVCQRHTTFPGTGEGGGGKGGGGRGGGGGGGEGGGGRGEGGGGRFSSVVVFRAINCN